MIGGHIKPHRFADALHGRVDASERARMDAHVAKCRACAITRERVGRASDSFTAIREQSSPDLPWDAVRTRVHWAVSKERRELEASGHAHPTAGRRTIPAVVWAALAVTAAAGLGLATGPAFDGVTVSGGGDGLAAASPGSAHAIPMVAATAGSAATPPAPRPGPRPLAGLVNRVSIASDLTIDGVRPADLFSRRIGAGTALATGDGSVDIQFGDASALALGPHSTLDVRRFDSDAIELAVDGTIDIEVAPRAANQRFIVYAGEHAIEVRGTQFRVARTAGSLTVSCRHGLVAVRDRGAKAAATTAPVASDDADTALVGAARRVELAPGTAIRDARVVPLSVEELAALVDATPVTMPVWDLDTLSATSAPLSIAGASRRAVRIDGIELGIAPLQIRVLPGRHTVEATDSAGRFRRAGWVDVAAPSAGARPARVDVPAEPAPGSAVAARRKQLVGGIDRARLARCTRSISKAGLTGTYVQVELSVDATGAVGFLNVIDTDLPSVTAACVREVLADVRFAAGPEATWREKIDL